MTLVKTLVAFNTATMSDNKIHDDGVARRFGFTGGLVPGVEVFAYMAHAPAKRWGVAWLQDGAISARFIKPVYDGEQTKVIADEVSGGGLSLAIETSGPCATGAASLRPPGAEIVVPPAAPRVPLSMRPRASPVSLPEGAALGSFAETFLEADGRSYLQDVREDLDLFEGGRIAHPGWLLRRANYLLVYNVLLGPWIHVESDVRLHRLLRAGELCETRGRVISNRESKGHLIADIDFALLGSAGPVMTGRHTAIYEPRQIRSAA